MLLLRDKILFDPPPLGAVLWLPGLPGAGNLIFNRSLYYRNHGTITGAMWKYNGRIHYLDFDGVDDVVNITSSLTTTLGTAAFFVSFRFKTATVAAYPDIVCNMQAGALSPNKDKGFTFIVRQDTHKLQFTIGDGTTTVGIKSNSVINDNKWHQAWGVRTAATGAGTLLMYVDGVLQTDTGNPNNLSLSCDTVLALASRCAGDTASLFIACSLTDVAAGYIAPGESDVLNSFSTRQLVGV